MTPESCDREIRRFDPTLPLEQAWTPPASWYTHAEFHRLEMQNVFGANWLIAARSDQVATPGGFVCGEIAGERYLIVRAEDGTLRAFYNVCRHHAAAVADGQGTVRRFSCPYHGWTYSLDGTLVNAPELGRIENFDPDRFALAPMAVEAWGPFVFISMAEKPRALSPDLAPLERALDDTGIASLTFVRRRRYTLACNWKVYVDNYLDGGYHVAYLHHGLAAQLDLASYRTEVFERCSIQSSAGGGKRGADDGGTDFAARIGSRALYAWIYPNFMINRYGPIMDTNWIIPAGPDRTDVVFDYYFADTEGAEAEAFIERSIAASDIVQEEDTGICEAVQRGLSSRAYDRGRYSPERETAEYHFHGLLAADLAPRTG